ncbi:hypothetical protein SKAU_G00345010 [Synaphobranchus kaupii]|uniref:Uncharacterized protein n=1 Tax=Synaphobranchus kaupii TaxID=118154 RepID=A0A9Q1IFG5_SYNKA|nr:hypothetical protein SKAU_G00345010 [Synaphobranchus kaupii]
MRVQYDAGLFQQLSPQVKATATAEKHSYSLNKTKVSRNTTISDQITSIIHLLLPTQTQPEQNNLTVEDLADLETFIDQYYHLQNHMDPDSGNPSKRKKKDSSTDTDDLQTTEIQASPKKRPTIRDHSSKTLATHLKIPSDTTHDEPDLDQTSSPYIHGRTRQALPSLIDFTKQGIAG